MSALISQWLCECACTQVSEAVFAASVEAHGVHSLAGSCFHTGVGRGQEIYQNLLHVQLMELFSILGCRHSHAPMFVHIKM